MNGGNLLLLLGLIWNIILVGENFCVPTFELHWLLLCPFVPSLFNHCSGSGSLRWPSRNSSTSSSSKVHGVFCSVPFVRFLSESSAPAIHFPALVSSSHCQHTYATALLRVVNLIQKRHQQRSIEKAERKGSRSHACVMPSNPKHETCVWCTGVCDALRSTLLLRASADPHLRTLSMAAYDPSSYQSEGIFFKKK